jgi:hypothetical protein
MYQFLFQNEKHRMNAYDYRRKNLSSTYGQFELKDMRKILKGDLTIHGHGAHPIYRFLAQHQMDHHFTGHVIEVSDVKMAMWIKLNNEQLTKGSLRYAGSFQDLKIQSLESFGKDLTSLSREKLVISQKRIKVNDVIRNLENLINTRDPDIEVLLSQTIQNLTKSSDSLRRDQNAAQIRVLKIEQDIIDGRAKVKQCLVDHAMDTLTRNNLTG